MFKKIIVMTITMVMVTSLSIAGECKLPKGCKYIDSEFSTGGGDKVSYVMEVTCQMPDNRIVKYLSWNMSVSGMFGFGRLTAPKKNYIRRR